MAITVTVKSGFEQDVYDRYCIGYLLPLEYDVNFGGDVTGELINLNFWLWGSLLEVPVNTPPPAALIKPPNGYNIVCAGVGSYIEVPIYGVQTGKKTWMNVVVYIRFVTTSTAIIRLRFMHTMQQKWWLNQLSGPNPNYKRLFHSEVDEVVEYDIDPDSIYNMWNAAKYLGVQVSRYTPGGFGTWDFVEEDNLADWRAWAWWWNPVSPDSILDYPYSPVISYEWELSRGSIPVSTFSTTEDTDVLFRMNTHVDTDFESEYFVILVKIDPVPDNDDQFWLESPVAEGEVTGTNSFGGFVSWFPHEINSSDIVTTCGLLTEITPDLWECEFTIPKEVVDSGCIYRLGVIVRNTFVGEPL